MQKGIRLSLLASLGILLVFTGCASGKNTNRINSLQAQISVLTEELIRLDDSLRQVRGAIQAEENKYNELMTQMSTAETEGSERR